MRGAELHVTVWGSPSDEPALLVHGSLSWGEDSWRKQRPLAEERELVVVDRRGFGDSPGPEAGDWEADAADLAALLEARPMHVVGHSYGGVSALLASALRPERVRSLTVIEPPALALVRGNADVEEFVERVDAAKREAADPLDYYRRFLAAFGLSTRTQRLDAKQLRAAASSWRERPPTEAEIPLDALRRAQIPILVVRGAWDSAPEALGRRALHPVCDVLVERLGAHAATVAGAAHSAQLVGAPFNERLGAFWASEC